MANHAQYREHLDKRKPNKKCLRKNDQVVRENNKVKSERFNKQIDFNARKAKTDKHMQQIT